MTSSKNYNINKKK